MVGEMSVRGNVLVGKCPVREVFLRKMFLGEVSVGEVSVGHLSSGKCPVGKLSYNPIKSQDCSERHYKRHLLI